MADAEVWGPDFALIPAPAATDRLPVATSPGSGGYSERGESVWRRATGDYRSNGPLVAGLAGADGTYNAGWYGRAPSGGTVDWDFKTNDATYGARTALTVTASGGIGIGTVSPLQKLHVSGADQNTARFRLQNVAAKSWDLIAGLNNAANNGFSIFNATDNVSALYIDNPGNVGIGIGLNNPGARLHVKSNSEIMRIETTTVRGSGSCYQTFRDPTGEKGYIGYGGGDDTFYVANLMSGATIFIVGAATGAVLGTSGFWPGNDNARTLGLPANRWSVVYAGTGTINTSDEREKTWREMLGIDVALFAPNLYEAELRAGLRAIEELGFFQWNDAIAAKGPDEARWHFGPRAQRVWSICADEGLCAALIEDPDTGDLLPPAGSIPPAFLCFDEWGEETAPVMEDVEIPAVLDDEGNEIEPARIEQQPTGETYVSRPAGNRFGVRIDQLHSLMIAALNAERLKQEATIADLVARVVALEPVA